MKFLKIGVLAFHGDVYEHIEATKKAAKKIKMNVDIIPVRTKEVLHNLDALVIPGGESTTIQKLCEREGMIEGIKSIRNIFGTCAGAIMLARTIQHKMLGQKTLHLMNIEIDRNAYGRQTESFEKDLKTNLGSIHAIFIRAPKIKKIGKAVNILARNNNEILACEERVSDCFYLATCFHPELTSTTFHEYFLKQVAR